MPLLSEREAVNAPCGFHTNRSRPLRGVIRLTALALAFGPILLLSAVPLVTQAQTIPAKRVLLISTGSRFGPGFMIVDQQVLNAVRTIPSPPIETYAENLDIFRFPAERSQRIFTDYLSEKYAEHPPDVVILVFVGDVGIHARILEDLFPRTPIILAGLTEEALRPDQFGSRVSGLAQRADPGATLELMLRLQPRLHRVVVVGGTASVDRQLLERVRKAAQPFKGRIDIEFWDNRTMAELRQSIGALPRDTAVLFTRLFRDAAGQPFVSSEVGQWIARSANAPVYVLSDAVLGTGAVGGSVASIEAFGKRAGELARSILTGTAPVSAPFEIRTETVPMFDWRALKRWHISESLLPPHSVVRFRSESMWERYRWQAFGALIVIVLQSAMIVGLILQRRHLRDTQAALQENRQLMELATSAGDLGLWSRDLTGQDVWVNAPLRALFGFGPDEALRFEDLIARVHPDDRARMASEAERAQAADRPIEIEYRAVLPDGTERWMLAKGRTMVDVQGRESRRMGVVLDITERKRAEEKLRESEDSFRRLVESTTAVIWQADFDSWLFTYVGPQAVDLLGYPLERWYEKHFWISHIHPADRELAVNTCLTMSRRAQDFDFDYRMIKASGEVVWVHDIVNCQHQDGKPRQLSGLMLDITKRKAAEQALRESEDRFRSMADAAPVMIWMSGTDKLCTFFNNGWLAFTGRTLEQELGNGWAKCVHKEDFHRCLALYGNAFDARQEFTMEYRLRRFDGEYRFVLHRGVPRFEPDGTFLGYIGTCIDVTELKGAEKSREEQRAFLRQVIDINPNFIFAKDRDGRFTLANQAVADAYGVRVEDLIGRTDADFNANDDEVAFFRKMDLDVMITLKERFIQEERMTDAEGRVRWLQTVKRPIIGSDGSANQMLGTSTDITHRRKTERELQKQRAELAHVSRVSTMGELAASIAHELNQPLTAILSNAQAAMRFITSKRANLEEIRDILGDIVKANSRAAEVIRRMRALVKKEHAADFATLDLASLIGDVIELVRSDAVSHSIRISLELESSLPPIRGDRVQLQQVVLNILLNAFDAMKACPVGERDIKLRATLQDSKTIRVSVSDCGTGVPDSELEKIFEAFYTTKPEGLGMGLSICRSIVEAHGGRLWAENNAGHGATFHVTLPVEGTA